MERPTVQKLLDDVRARKIDVNGLDAIFPGLVTLSPMFTV